ncbi:MAG: hypothetical protein ABI367_13930 [Mucilaginibacter sp.]
MNNRLEEFVKANREEFNDIEPSADLWSRIEKELPVQLVQQKKNEIKTFSLGFVLRIAASVIIVMAISFVLYLHNENANKINYASINPVYAQQRVQYTKLIATKRTELQSLAQADPELYKEFSAETTKMDSIYRKLNSDLATSPNPELVLRAMIKNLEIQTEVLNQQLTIIEQYNQTKRQNESKNI